MADNVRPSFLGAWGLVLIDIALVTSALVYSFKSMIPFFQYRANAFYFSGLLFTVLYLVLPLAVLANGGIWAQRTRSIKE